MSLRREVFIGIMRLWDDDPKSVGIPVVLKLLEEKIVIEALGAEREKAHLEAPINLITRSVGKDRDLMMEYLRKQRIEEAPNQRTILRGQVTHAASLIEGVNARLGNLTPLEKMKKLRDRLLAHRDIRFKLDPGEALLDQEVEDLYLNMLEILKALRLAIENASYNPLETANHFRRYAEYFWSSVCGESNPRHPNYRLWEAPCFDQIC